MNNEYSLADFINQLMKWKKQLLRTAGIIILLSVAGSLLLPNYYEAETTFYAPSPAVTWLANVTLRTPIPNFAISITRAQFAANLRANGFAATQRSNGVVRYTSSSSGVSYVIRGATSTPRGGAIDVLNSSNQVIRVYRPTR